MRKHVLAICVAVMLSMLFVACGVDKETQQVIDDINAIGDVTLDSQDTLSDIRKEYNALSEEQQKKVSNYQKFEDAQNVFNVLQTIYFISDEPTVSDVTSIESATEQYEKLSSDQKKLITNYDKLVSAQGQVDELKKQKEGLNEAYDLTISSLKSRLKNPSSFKELDRRVHSSKETKRKYYVKINYSATNDFGGTLDATYFAYVKDGKITGEFDGNAQDDWDVLTFLDFDMINSLY